MTTIFYFSKFATTGYVSLTKVANLFFIVSALSSARPDVSPLFNNLYSITASEHSNMSKNLAFTEFPIILVQLSQLSYDLGNPSKIYLPVFPKDSISLNIDFIEYLLDQFNKSI